MTAFPFRRFYIFGLPCASANAGAGTHGGSFFMTWNDLKICSGCSVIFKPKWHGINKFCSRACNGRNNAKPGALNPNWKGGRVGRKDGRIRIYNPDRKTPSGCTDYILEYRIIAGNKIGRTLRDDEIVHHIDGDATNNDPSNLEIMSQSDHAAEHAKDRRDVKTGRFF